MTTDQSNKLDAIYKAITDTIKIVSVTKVNEHLSAGATISISNLVANKEYRLISVRGNMVSGPNCTVQEGSITSITNCKYERLDNYFYKITPTTSNIKISIASTSGGGYYYDTLIFILSIA